MSAILMKLNGRVTEHACPRCESKTAKVSHGSVLGDPSLLAHFYECGCGTFISHPLYDCADCISTEESLADNPVIVYGKDGADKHGKLSKAAG